MKNDSWICVYLCLVSNLNTNYVFVHVYDSVEYNVSYVYHAMYAYFDRDNVALKGLAK